MPIRILPPRSSACPPLHADAGVEGLRAHDTPTLSSHLRGAFFFSENPRVTRRLQEGVDQLSTGSADPQGTKPAPLQGTFSF